MTLLGIDQVALGVDATSTTTVALVAQPPSAPNEEDPGGRGEDFGKSSPIGLLVILLFFVAVAFLVRSMTKHLKRLPKSFDPPDETIDESLDGQTPAEDGEEKKSENGDPASRKG
ncbi:hypothetical protein BLA60_28460 [Actinophytocola xinjiangensis]|uniref:Uncharacterized protein n=1 Tax=Actinophytocola xinjiangensis TaxID=485602 RepID=A0A7Z0WHX7_9PSEU|nr:hypothetical protein [Actinophytocola xinjiangensis]OLF07147.1 hypothetical protein BLA60_28460 [Actinophytocola xinjiangensis]